MIARQSVHQSTVLVFIVVISALGISIDRAGSCRHIDSQTLHREARDSDATATASYSKEEPKVIDNGLR